MPNNKVSQQARKLGSTWIRRQERGTVTPSWGLSANGRECELVAMLAPLPTPVPGSGSSDCSHCRSHLWLLRTARRTRPRDRPWRVHDSLNVNSVGVGAQRVTRVKSGTCTRARRAGGLTDALVAPRALARIAAGVKRRFRLSPQFVLPVTVTGREVKCDKAGNIRSSCDLASLARG